ncbi:Ribosome recycling factor [Leishmania donovani]|uniref:Ribosome recycling factor family protein n=1 Tax=Leishmania donovani TaxID=5661 RepID=A0A504X8N2_LEIDO|nr:Ribosome recycling factor family protein [Leishmania donovani]CAJ1990828.1 Ribosome recycling factor [Leishmania donovani]VDZ46679.1 Ribosome_recycling_factor_putative/Pfam:PF01765 [Leishmania donovani]
MLRCITHSRLSGSILLSGAAVPRLSQVTCTSTWASSSSLTTAKALWCSATAPLRKDIRKNDRGDARRLTFEERAERRMGKTKDQRESREQLAQEAQVMVSEDFPEELEAIYAKTSEKANISAMKVLNMAKCLELLEVEVAGGHTVLLVKVAQVVKTSTTTIEITPNSASFGNTILQRVSRFDSALQVSKEGTKIRVVIPPITTARRDKTVAEVNNLISTFRQRVKQSRTKAVKVLQDAGLADGVQQELTALVDSTANAFVEEKAAELELLSEEVMTMGIDESDVAAGR